jgi:exosortase/archaeosortase family protein
MNLKTSIENWIKQIYSNHKKVRNYLFVLIFVLIVFLFYSIIKSKLTFLINLYDRILVLYLSNLLSGACNILKLLHFPVSADLNQVFLNGKVLFEIDNSFLSKKWFVVTLLIIWITPSDVRSRILYSLISIPLNYILNIFQLFIVFFFYDGSKSIVDLKLIGYTIVWLGYISFVIFWLKKNKELIFSILSKYNYNIDFIKKKSGLAIVLLFIAVFINNFLVGYLDFKYWIIAIFNTSKYILSLMGYDAIVDDVYLIGENGTIYMAKFCLGIQTTIIFTLFILLTGQNLKKQIFYVLFGIIVINVVNILRFVLLFIHLQKHGEYKLTMDLHDIFNIVVYSVVFVLWIIWLEKYSDVWKYIRTTPINEN